MKKTIFFILLSVCTFASPDKGMEIAKKMDAARKGFLGEVSTMKLILIDSAGNKVERMMSGESLEGDTTTKTLMTFIKPADVKGIKLLTWANEDREDNQWLYLPSMKRVKRINSRTRGSSFMGSEFSFEDLGGQTINKYNFNYLKDVKHAKSDVWLLERKPKEKSSYSRVVLTVDKKLLIALKADYYNKRNQLQKTAEFSNIKGYKISGKTIYRASRVHMKNILTKKESIFEWNNLKLGVKAPERNFSKNNLK
jgi:outer membrane lipoprotein-sorting protein